MFLQVEIIYLFKLKIRRENNASAQSYFGYLPFGYFGEQAVDSSQ